jgi:hypothetical protein
MGTVLVHAGMPKTGSTSIQTWLSRHADALRQSHGMTVLAALQVVEPGDAAVSEGFVRRYFMRAEGPGERARAAGEYLDALARAADEWGCVLISGESFSNLIHDVDTPFLGRLEDLAGRHEVRVLYYVRPQDAALEARWRQWAFLTPAKPSVWVESQTTALSYLQTLQAVRAECPSVSFDMRPFRRDLLVDHDVVADFAGWLGLHDPPATGDIRERPGLTTDLAILLRGASPPIVGNPFTAGQTVETRYSRLVELTREWDVDVSAEVRRSRHVLSTYAHERFEGDNRSLIEMLDWGIDSFVPTPDPGAAGADLSELDRLWEPTASHEAVTYLHQSLSQILG